MEEIQEPLILEYNPFSKDDNSMDYRNSNYKKIKFKFNDEKISFTLNQDFKVGKGGIFWDGSFVLSMILLDYLKYKKEFQILELGAGTALPSLISLYYGHNVYITDIEKNLKIIEDNLKDNINLIKGKAIVQKLNWGDDCDISRIKKTNLSFDIIICSELVYWEDLFDDLIKTIKELSSLNTKIFFSFKMRLKEIADIFHDKLSKYFTYEYVK